MTSDGTSDDTPKAEEEQTAQRLREEREQIRAEQQRLLAREEEIAQALIRLEGHPHADFSFVWHDDHTPMVHDGYFSYSGIQVEGPKPDPEHEGVEMVRITVRRWAKGSQWDGTGQLSMIYG